jgi:hypothetical protein
LLSTITSMSYALTTSQVKSKSTANPGTAEYPWTFSGRLWFRPALVPVPTSENQKPSPPPSVSILSLFGWTLGGVVALEYDDSPVGPYREYVTMGAIVSKRGALGQWGSRLYVSNTEAERICQEIWKVPAEVADIEFREGNAASPSRSSTLAVTSAPDPTKTNKMIPQIMVDGWANTRTIDTTIEEAVRRGGLPVLWTPTIKALWAPFVPFLSSPSSSSETDKLPLHPLQLSASALRLHWCGQESSELLGIPIGIGLSLDNVRIEIGPENGKL